MMPIVREGDARDCIVDLASELTVDLVVMGAKSKSKLKRALLGSVSDYCVHHCACPVLVIRE